MKKITVILIVSLLLFNLFLIIPEPLTPVPKVSALRYGMDTDLSTVDARINGSGSPAGVGDVNGDGFDDFIISDRQNSDNAQYSGKVFLFFGKSSGWSMDMNLSHSEASFHGEYYGNYAGLSAEGAGDVNGDGLDDILIGSPYYAAGGWSRGAVYVIFGKTSGWAENVNLSKADASFIGAFNNQRIGFLAEPLGDVNADGFDDFIVSNGGKPYLFFGKSSGWTMNTTVSDADASFVGENPGDNAGSSVAGVGDVNKDGFDDFIIGAPLNKEAANNAGKIYLILGKSIGWSTDTDLGDSLASFTGEAANNRVGDRQIGDLDGAGDINGDGYYDFMIGAGLVSQGYNNNGKVYIILGKSSGWSRGTSLADADASYIGEGGNHRAGTSVTGAGDVNSDGYDDMVISSPYASQGWVGTSYVILGKNSGWVKNNGLENASASFNGASGDQYTGLPVRGAGDVNGDGHNDILIGAWGSISHTYLVFLEFNFGPQVVFSVNAYCDPGCSEEIVRTEVEHTVYVQLDGLDENATNEDMAAVNVNVTSGSMDSIRLYLIETDLNSGIYRGSFKISDNTNPGQRNINATVGDNITISSVKDPGKSVDLEVSVPVQIRPLTDKNDVLEDDFYYMTYHAIGYNTVSSWTFESNASWLSWDTAAHNISGTPNNGDVGTYWVRLNITDGLGHFDEHLFNVKVQNTPPQILNEDNSTAFEDELYTVDYESGDESQGDAHWWMDTNASWLSLNPDTGNLSGTPYNRDRGPYWVNITIDDGNNATAWSNFSLEVIDTNDVPVILTEDVFSVLEDEYYEVDYEATDIDGPTTFQWYLETSAKWLAIDNGTGVLNGTPSNDDVGSHYVNVTVVDERNGSTSSNFTLGVINVKQT
jgi:hypothetical protein